MSSKVSPIHTRLAVEDSAQSANSAQHGMAYKLTRTFTLSFVALLAALMVGLYLSIGTVLNVRIDEDLIEDIAEYDQFYRQRGLARLIEELQRETALGEHHSVFIRLFSDQNEELYRSNMQSWRAIGFNQAIADDPNVIAHAPVLETQEFPEHEAPTRIVYGKIGDDLLLQMGENTEEKQEIMALLLTSFLLVFSLSLPIASALIYFQARRSARSIESVSQMAIAIGRGDFSRRVKLDANERETYQLASCFNQMAQRVQSLIAEMREMIDNIAHDLRSPLGRIRAIAEMSLTGSQEVAHYQQVAENTLHECDRLLGLINMTLDVAEAEAGVIRGTYQPVDVSAMVLDVCELFEPSAEQKGINMQLAICEDCHLNGGLPSLQRMVANLLDNAIKYTPKNGTVAVTLRKDNLGMRIAVCDTGVGIPSHEQKRVFERFFRCDQSRTLEGSGLGLSYSRAVARAHGGDIAVTSEPATRTEFTIFLPAVSN